MGFRIFGVFLFYQSRILRDLSYQFLSELAKKMQTIHYIPGDAIIKRNTIRSSIIYVTYGDVEVVEPNSIFGTCPISLFICHKTQLYIFIDFIKRSEFDYMQLLLFWQPTSNQFLERLKKCYF